MDGITHVYAKETSIFNPWRMLAPAGAAWRLKTGGRVRICDNWSQRNELIEEDKGKKTCWCSWWTMLLFICRSRMSALVCGVDLISTETSSYLFSVISNSAVTAHIPIVWFSRNHSTLHIYINPKVRTTEQNKVQQRLQKEMSIENRCKRKY